MNQQSTALTPSQLNRLTTIWSIVESRKNLPVMIVVTAATDADDTESIARGLAQAAHGAGQRTAYLRLPGKALAATPAPYTLLSLESRGSLREALDTAAASWRTMYDVVVIDAAALSSAALGAHAVRIGDGVVIGVCDGRRVVPADRELARLLSELGASVIGAVMTAPVGKAAVPAPSPSQSRLRAAA